MKKILYLITLLFLIVESQLSTTLSAGTTRFILTSMMEGWKQITTSSIIALAQWTWVAKITSLLAVIPVQKKQLWYTACWISEAAVNPRISILMITSKTCWKGYLSIPSIGSMNYCLQTGNLIK